MKNNCPQIIESNKQTDAKLVYSMNVDQATNYIEIRTNVSNHPLRFFIDTGSDVSLIKKETVNQSCIDHARTIRIKGITNGEVNSIGTLKMSFQKDYVTYPFQLDVVDNDFPIATDGIIGRNFLDWYGIVLNYKL